MTVIRANESQGCTICGQRNDLVPLDVNNQIGQLGFDFNATRAGLPVWGWLIVGVAVAALLGWVVWPKKK